MESGILDKTGRLVKLGDTIILPYIDPFGDITEDPDCEAVVVFKYGCFGLCFEDCFMPLMDFMIKKKGEYISNVGNKTIYTNRYVFWIKTND